MDSLLATQGSPSKGGYLLLPCLSIDPVVYFVYVLGDCIMVGSIRAFGGLLLCFGAAGGLDNSNNLLASVAIALVGIGIMYSGVSAMNRGVK